LASSVISFDFDIDLRDTNPCKTKDLSFADLLLVIRQMTSLKTLIVRSIILQSPEEQEQLMKVLNSRENSLEDLQFTELFNTSPGPVFAIPGLQLRSKR
jgi:hypothetical protein